jgi:hypothetical protein
MKWQENRIFFQSLRFALLIITLPLLHIHTFKIVLSQPSLILSDHMPQTTAIFSFEHLLPDQWFYIILFVARIRHADLRMDSVYFMQFAQRPHDKYENIIYTLPVAKNTFGNRFTT